jgi:hypothetical protein
VAALPDADAGHVEIVRNPAGMADSAQIERIAIETTQPLRRELAAFVGHVEGGPPPRSSMRDTVAILDAIARARELAGLVSNAPKP